MAVTYGGIELRTLGPVPEGSSLESGVVVATMDLAFSGYAGTWVSGSWSGVGVDSATAASVYWIWGLGEVGQ